MTSRFPSRYVVALAAFLTAFHLPSSLHADNAAEAAAIVTLATDHPEQGRPEIIIDSILSQTAQAKAEDMLARGYFSHTDPDGICPNHLAETFGYILPASYSQDLDGNNIESIYKESGMGAPSAGRTFGEWLNSPGHRTHVLATDAGGFYAQQTHIGVGVASDPNTDTNIFVFITAPPSEGGEPPPPADTWTVYYDLAQSYYDYYAGIGSYYFASAFYYYYQNYGTYLYNLAYGNSPEANFYYSNSLALYYYYLYIGYADYSSANFYYYYYLAVAYYYYYLGYGDGSSAQYYYNLYMGYAFGS